MQIVSRAGLSAFLSGPTMDPEGDRREEMLAFAAAIQSDAPDSVTHFVYTDNENGDDPVVSWPDYSQDDLVVEELIPLTVAASGDYYGLRASRKSFYLPEDPRRIYDCYLGGCPISSAPGFVITAATLAE